MKDIMESRANDNLPIECMILFEGCIQSRIKRSITLSIYFVYLYNLSKNYFD